MPLDEAGLVVGHRVDGEDGRAAHGEVVVAQEAEEGFHVVHEGGGGLVGQDHVLDGGDDRPPCQEALALGALGEVRNDRGRGQQGELSEALGDHVARPLLLGLAVGEEER